MNEDRAARYHRLQRRAAIGGIAAGASWLILLLASGMSAALASFALRAGQHLPWPLGRLAAIVLVVFVVALGAEIASLPFGFYRSFVLDRKYGLSSEPVATWMTDHLKALSLGLALTIAAGVGMYGAMHVAGDAWWLAGGLLFGAGGIVLSRIAPVLLMPLFYRFRPLENAALRERLATLSTRAGVAVVGSFEWGLGAKTTRANAALVGAGGTRRILVSDTLLKDYSDDEIEVILAHELAHHVYYDIWTALGLEAAVVALALYGAQVAVTRGGAPFHVTLPGDLAALPLLALAAGGVSLLLSPVANAWSRHNERRADRFAVTLTGRPAAFISAIRRLGAQNLAEERPSAAAVWFFHTHPTLDERIAAARAVNR